MSDRPVECLLKDIEEAIDRIQRYVAELDKEKFIQDDKTSDAVVRNMEIIGEAANRIPDEFQEANDQVPWRQIIGLRNRVVHEYFGVDLDLVWKIIEDDLPTLKSHLADSYRGA